MWNDFAEFWTSQITGCANTLITITEGLRECMIGKKFCCSDDRPMTKNGRYICSTMDTDCTEFLIGVTESYRSYTSFRLIFSLFRKLLYGESCTAAMTKMVHAN